ncbi:MAG: VacJ family lipoprotein [Campylobacterales bacterium]|nr:VacJ family lipoprotein [Campylobacterales bacterium]
MKNLLIILFTFFLSLSYVQGETNVTEHVTTSQEDEFEDFDEFEEETSVEEESDPFEGFNRVMTTFNDKVYVYVYDPVGRGYRWIVPTPARESVANFFDNILYPIRLVNNLLQGKFKNSAEETGRFVINTTIGILGLFDPAKSYFGLEPHPEDFGQTLGYYGVGAGPHIVLPFLGPSNLRDTFSLYPDYMVDLTYYYSERGYNLLSSSKESLGATVFDKVNDESLRIGTYESIKEDAVDLYPFLKNIYEQNRKKLISE